MQSPKKSPSAVQHGGAASQTKTKLQEQLQSQLYRQPSVGFTPTAFRWSKIHTEGIKPLEHNDTRFLCDRKTRVAAHCLTRKVQTLQCG